MFGITPSARLRPSPFYEATLAEGVCAFTTYNHMLMPTSYGKPLEEYWRLINGVSQWDVAVERQVQLRGPDAGRLAQILAPRDLSACKEGQGKYVPLVNHQGVLINDPICLKLADDLYWLSIADSNIWFWASAIAAELGHLDPDGRDILQLGSQIQFRLSRLHKLGGVDPSRLAQHGDRLGGDICTLPRLRIKIICVTERCEQPKRLETVAKQNNMSHDALAQRPSGKSWTCCASAHSRRGRDTRTLTNAKTKAQLFTIHIFRSSKCQRLPSRENRSTTQTLAPNQ